MDALLIGLGGLLQVLGVSVVVWEIERVLAPARRVVEGWTRGGAAVVSRPPAGTVRVSASPPRVSARSGLLDETHAAEDRVTRLTEYAEQVDRDVDALWAALDRRAVEAREQISTSVAAAKDESAAAVAQLQLVLATGRKRQAAGAAMVVLGVIVATVGGLMAL